MVRARVFRLPMFVIAGALLGLIALLATLQYRWLGQVSDAEREQMTATVTGHAKAFGEDVDRELTRAYLLFQLELSARPDAGAQDVASRYERWQATARFPRLIKYIYVVSPGRAREGLPLERYDAAARALEPSAWPAQLARVRSQIDRPEPAGIASTSRDGVSTFVYRAVLPSIPAVWPDVPALVIGSPLLLTNDDAHVTRAPSGATEPPAQRHTILLLDGDYIRREMLPALARQHFGNDGVDYRLAVVSTSGAADPVYRSTSEFSPSPDSAADARVDFFQVRAQDFTTVATEINRFVTFTTTDRRTTAARANTLFRISDDVGPRVGPKGASTPPARWRLLVQHPSGSLEEAVNAARRRNLAISSSVLGILALSVAFLFVSTRRAQDLARQQLEFVATVSHELRTPLAVIRSAADNLADGTVNDEPRVRQYGELVRREGLRLTDLVEQILEFAGLQSGERSLAPRPVEIGGVLRDVVRGAQDAAREPLTFDIAIADHLPPVLGDEAALRRVFQNLVGNAIKYGDGARWVGVQASASFSCVNVTVRDRGIGIAAADQERIFAPFYRAADVVSAQIQGAGLGLSLVKRIVEAHEGRITVESAPRDGSAFTITLPIASGYVAEGSIGETARQHS